MPSACLYFLFYFYILECLSTLVLIFYISVLCLLRLICRINWELSSWSLFGHRAKTHVVRVLMRHWKRLLQIITNKEKLTWTTGLTVIRTGLACRLYIITDELRGSGKTPLRTCLAVWWKYLRFMTLGTAWQRPPSALNWSSETMPFPSKRCLTIWTSARSCHYSPILCNFRGCGITMVYHFRPPARMAFQQNTTTSFLTQLIHMHEDICAQENWLKSFSSIMALWNFFNWNKSFSHSTYQNNNNNNNICLNSVLIK